MTWRKYFKPVNSVLPANQRIVDSTSAYASTAKYSNWLPECLSGPPDRLQRYSVYEQMNFDNEISSALDTLADFGTENDPVTGLPLIVEYNDEPTPSEIEIIEKSLKQWCKLNELSKRLWRIFRSTLVYGDQLFIRDPETFKLYWIDPAKVEKVIVNESDGRKIESYFIKDIDLNMKSLVATNQLNKLSNEAFGANSIVFSPPMQGNMNYVSGGFGGVGTANYQDGNATAVDAEHIVHISLTDGMTQSWPFGLSILETIYKVYKQKELLEDSVLIYRVHRAPERRMFFIDVGSMPPNKAHQYLERVRYEVQQKRIPSRTSDGRNVGDSTYNPLSVLEDYFFAVGCLALDTKIPLLDGRTLTLNDCINEFNRGKENFTYTINQDTQKMIPGKIVWGGITRKNAKVMEVLLDNGEIIRCTPDHRFIMRDGSEIEAQYLKENDSLMPFYLNAAKTSSKQKGNPYLRHVDNATGKMLWVHTTICPKSKTGKETEIHHIDFNSKNNNPTNLIEMETNAHRELHKKAGTYSLQKQWDSEEGRENLIKGMKTYHENKTEEQKKTISTRNSKNGSKTKDSPKSKAANEAKKGKAFKLAIRYSQEMFDILVNFYNQGYNSVSKMNKILKTSEKFQEAYRMANPLRVEKKMLTIGIDDGTLNNTVKFAGYSSWGNFKENYNFNHKVIKIIFLEDTEDTGDITIESDGDYHNFATAAGIYVHNSDGRGSRIEILPGGENLGCFSLDTEIMLTDGRNLSITEIERELNSGKELWTYSCHPITGEKTSGIISWAGKTKSNSKVMKLILSNNKEIICTLDHKFPIEGLGFVEAQDLPIGIKFFGCNNDSISLTNIEYLENTIDVGCLSIDREETRHNYHTFALSVGIFSSNSIDDLKYFNNKMIRALGVPSSYLPTGPEDGTAAVNDGRVGTAYIQEFRFSKVVGRHQKQCIDPLDLEFKLFLKKRGVNIDNSLFNLSFTPPQSFSEYRQLELDSAKVNVFSALTDVSFVSKRYLLKRYLGWTEAELAENEKMWKEERSRLKTQPGIQQSSTGAGGLVGGPGMTGGPESSSAADLSNVGITSSDIDNMSQEGTEQENPEAATDQEIDNFGEG